MVIFESFLRNADLFGRLLETILNAVALAVDLAILEQLPPPEHTLAGLLNRAFLDPLEDESLRIH